MKFKKLAKVISCNFVRVNLIENDYIRSVYESETGLCEGVVKQYGEYKVDSVDVDKFTLPFENLKHSVLDICLEE